MNDEFHTWPIELRLKMVEDTLQRAEEARRASIIELGDILNENNYNDDDRRAANRRMVGICRDIADLRSLLAVCNRKSGKGGRKE